MNEKLNEKTIAIVGLGYVGLPTMIEFHKSGFNVVGIDISEQVIETLQSGKNHLIDSTDDIKIPRNSSKWRVTLDFKASIPNSDIVIITVPTPVNKDKTPNLEYVKDAINKVVKNLNVNKKTTIILESTVYPGVTREITNNAILNYKIDRRIVEIAYCPERVSPGEIGKNVGNISRVLGCDSKANGEELANMYSMITKGGCKYVGKIEIAEAAKLVENVQRDIDIAFANELAIILPKMGIDVEQVLDAASSKWNFHRHKPGIGVGGHCIPVDPYYYIAMSESLGERASLSIAAREINKSMPNHAANSVAEILVNYPESKILIMGYSYKPELGDVRETPIEEFSKILKEKGCNITVWDPYVKEKDFPKWVNGINSIEDIEGFDIAVLATAHRKFIDLNWEKLLEKSEKGIIYDGRRVLDKDKMNSIGWNYRGIGLERN